MLVKEKAGNLSSFEQGNRILDRVTIEWYETNKRILHKKSRAGREVILKSGESQMLTEDDILWYDETVAIVVEIAPCDAISIVPSSMGEMAGLCYEIGNKHLPLFYENEELIVPFEAPLFKMLTAAGYTPKRESRKLLNQLKTTVAPHSAVENKQSLFSKILQLTTSSDNA